MLICAHFTCLGGFADKELVSHRGSVVKEAVLVQGASRCKKGCLCSTSSMLSGTATYCWVELVC